MTECSIWPPERVFDVPTEELKLIGIAIAKKKGEEQKFLAMIHGAKAETQQVGQPEPKDLEGQFDAMKQKGFPVEDL